MGLEEAQPVTRPLPRRAQGSTSRGCQGFWGPRVLLADSPLPQVPWGRGQRKAPGGQRQGGGVCPSQAQPRGHGVIRRVEVEGSAAVTAGFRRRGGWGARAERSGPAPGWGRGAGVCSHTPGPGRFYW